MACSGGSVPRESVERLAILPFENLTGNADLDWISRFGAAAVAYDLTGPKHVHPLRVESIIDARTNRAGRVVQGYFTREHGSLTFHARLADHTLLARASGDDVVAAMNGLAKELSAEARTLSGCNAAAQRLDGEILLGRRGPDAYTQGDGCVPIYLQSAELLLSRGDREGAARACTAGLALPRLDAIDSAQFSYLGAITNGDLKARLDALQKMAAALPNDPDVLRNLAELRQANREPQEAVRIFEAALRADPDDAQVWNELGYARAALHDLAGARDALEHYQKLLTPENTNALDSLGEVSFFLGDFAAAERYFLEAQQKNPEALGGRELLKAAQARMMSGDLAQADRLLARQAKWSELDRAQWEFITGRRKQAMARLQLLPQNPVAVVQLVVWEIETGLKPAMAIGSDPLNRAVTLLFAGQFREAVPLLEQLYRAASPGVDGQVRTLLAWAYTRAGQTDAASKLLDLYPIPIASAGGNPLFTSLVFPRFAQLRGEVLNSAKDQQLARMYAGDLPDR